MTSAQDPLISPNTRLLMDPEPAQATTDSISVVALLTAILRYRRWVIGVALVAAVIMGALTVSKARTYTSSAAFIPQTRGATSAFASAAGLVGLLPGGGDQSQAPQFYADLLTSDELLRGMIDTVYPFAVNGRLNKQALRDILVPGNGVGGIREQRAVEGLQHAISVKTAMKTGVVTFRVQTRYPELSRMLTGDLLDRLNDFNMQARMNRAGTERKFTEGRLASAQAELRDSENRLQQFMQYNQDFRTSSRLSVYQDQLQREVNTRQAVYTTLAQAYEQARIEEVRNTPVIMVVQHARLPVVPDPRRLVLRVVIAFILTAIVAALLALLRDYFWGERGSKEPGAVEEFRAVVRDTVNDVKHPIRAIRGGKGVKRFGDVT